VGDDAEIGNEAWGEAREDALEALRHALMWELPEPSWHEVASAVSEMALAIVAGSADLLSRSTGSLELCSPLRTQTRAGEGKDSSKPAPKPVQEQIAVTIKDLTRAGDLKPGR